MTVEFDFVKLHGAGNDFVFIGDLEDEISLGPQEVERICDRHFGIGADGVVLVKPPRDPANDGFMDYRNSDGTIAQMCGNGVRCMAKYLVDFGIVEKNTPLINVETRAGVKVISYETDEAGKLALATVDMGTPELNPQKVPTTLSFNAMSSFGEAYVKDAMLDSPFGAFAFTCVSMGNPHAISFVEDCESLDVDAVGAYFESHEAFPEKSNIEFASIADDGIHMRVYERGCGETLACGTGACATNVAACLNGLAPGDNDLILLGGTLHISYTPGASVLMTGPACEVFRGHVRL